jgi:hypothetical protein
VEGGLTARVAPDMQTREVIVTDSAPGRSAPAERQIGTEFPRIASYFAPRAWSPTRGGPQPLEGLAVFCAVSASQSASPGCPRPSPGTRNIRGETAFPAREDLPQQCSGPTYHLPWGPKLSRGPALANPDAYLDAFLGREMPISKASSG